jgi:hypothetical protein
MKPTLIARAAMVAVALALPITAQAQLGKLGKKLGKAIGEEVVGKPADSKSSSAPTVTPEKLDAFLKGIALEAGPRMPARQKYLQEVAAYRRWESELDSLSKLLSAEYGKGNDAAAKCQPAAGDPAAMQANMQMAKKMQSMSPQEREALEARMESWGEKMRAAYESGDMKTFQAYADSMRNAMGVDVASVSVSQNNAYQQCLAREQASAGMDMDRIQQINDRIAVLQQNRPNQPDRSAYDIPQAQRDSLRAAGVATSGLPEAEYAWVREQAWAYLAMISRGDLSSAEPEWLEMFKAREAELKKYEFVIVEG